MPEYRTAYFLFDRFRIATTSNANVSRIMNSSYVLIKYHTFLQTRERVGARPSASQASVLCCQCPFVLQDDCLGRFSFCGTNCAGAITKTLESDRGGVPSNEFRRNCAGDAPDRGGVSLIWGYLAWPFWTGLCCRSGGAEGNLPCKGFTT